MEQILNFDVELNIALLDQVVKCLYESKITPQIQEAQKVLTQFQNHPQAWTKVNTIYTQSTYNNTKYLALCILLETVKFKWNIIPPNQKEGMKNFVIAQVLNKSKDENVMKEESLILKKLDEILVQIAKKEWPQNWSNFIPQLAIPNANQNMCENNITILKLLSEEVFDFSSGNLTQQKVCFFFFLKFF